MEKIGVLPDVALTAVTPGVNAAISLGLTMCRSWSSCPLIVSTVPTLFWNRAVRARWTWMVSSAVERTAAGCWPGCAVRLWGTPCVAAVVDWARAGMVETVLSRNDASNAR